MRNKWNDFVNFLRPWTVGSFPLQSLQACLHSVLGSMLSKKLTIDGLSLTHQESSLVINKVVGYENNAPKVAPFMPIRLMDLDNFLREDMEKMGCKIGITIGNDIKLYYYSDSIEKTVCVCKMKLDTDDSIGQKFFSLLTADNFVSKELLDYCRGLFYEMNPEALVLRILNPYISYPNIKIKQLLKTELVNKGLGEDIVDEVLKKISVSVSYNGQGEQEQAENKKNEATTSHDTTRFSIDGINYLSKRNFVLTVVKQYVKEHPGISYEELNNMFRSDIISKVRGVVRPLAMVTEWIKTQPDLTKRYCMGEDEIITLSSGEKVVVYNQWGSKSFPKFLELIEHLYTISCDRNYPDYPLASCSESVKEEFPEKEYRGINISFGSLQNFKKRK